MKASIVFEYDFFDNVETVHAVDVAKEALLKAGGVDEVTISIGEYNRMKVWIIFSNRIAANRDNGEVLGVFDSQSLAEQFAIDWKRLNVLVGDWDVWVEPIILNQERFTTLDEWSDAQ